MHHPTKKHFTGAVDDPFYDSDKPYQHLTKVKLRLDHYRELDHTLLHDIIFIVYVPILCHTGDPISVQIGSKVISVQCPRLARRQNRFILCFVKWVNTSKLMQHMCIMVSWCVVWCWMLVCVVFTRLCDIAVWQKRLLWRVFCFFHIYAVRILWLHCFVYSRYHIRRKCDTCNAFNGLVNNVEGNS